MSRPGHTSDATHTREQLLDAAEALFVAEGPANVSLRAILREAGQKNQSAMQYHFGNRAGLMAAIRERRLMQIEARRAELLKTDLDLNNQPSPRACCALLIRAPFMLCNERRDFKAILGAMGSQLLFSEEGLLHQEINEAFPSLWRIGEYLLNALEPIHPTLWRLRLENTQGAALLAIARRARAGQSFKGRQAELFFNNLVDQLTAMLVVPASQATEDALGQSTGIRTRAAT